MSIWVLDAITKSITITMTGAAATTDPDYASSWFDETSTTSTPGAADGALSGATPVTVVPAPAGSTQRVIKEIAVYNRDTASVTFYVKYVSGGTRFLKKVTLGVDEQFTIEANYDNTGAIKTAIASIPVHDHTGAGSGGQLNAGSVFSAGQVPLAHGGTNADLSATGGTGQFLKQSSAAAAITVGTIADTDVPNILTLTEIDDTNGNEQIKFVTTASAVNEVTHTNAATGNAPKIEASGGDTDIDLSIGGKGAGNVKALTPIDANDKQILKALYEDLKSAAAPANPPSGYDRLYLDSADSHLKIRDSSGNVYDLFQDGAGEAIFSYEVASGTNGGTYTSGSWVTRPLNTSRRNTIASASLSSNQITLPAGTYRVRWWATLYAVNGYNFRLQNITDTATITNGTSGNTPAGTTNPASENSDVFTIAGTKTLELQMKAGATRATDGMGTDGGQGTNVYTIIEFIKEK